MYRLSFLIIAALFSVSANAGEWKPLTPTAYTLSPSEDSKIVALATLNGESIIVNLLDFSGAFCGEAQSSELIKAGPYKVNGTNVKFVQACINGNRVLSPETQKGKDLFAAAVTTNPVTVELDLGLVLHFTSEDFETTKKQMFETKSAL